MRGWPAFRTQPDDEDFSPHFWAFLVVFVFVPLASYLLAKLLFSYLLAKLLFSSMPALFGPYVRMQSSLIVSLLYGLGGWLAVLAVSPFLSWLGLAIGVPLAIVAHGTGWAGWAVAASGGACSGAAVGVAVALYVHFSMPNFLDPALFPIRWGGVWVFSCVGLNLGLAYWLALRVSAPYLFMHWTHPSEGPPEGEFWT